ncbi:MAG: hypothetical protein EBX52_07545 [Proteobacteria bacterium]|nr:hypothetical protein [Pseudomonadota bacterium]
MSTRRIHQAPTYTLLHEPKILDRVLLEVKKLKPAIEVSVENCTALAKGRIVDWNLDKKLFTVSWGNLPEVFAEAAGRLTGQRSFFKVQTFTTQLVFKAEVIRRLPDGTYQYRTPAQIYQTQKRGALRVPLTPGLVKIASPKGIFPVLDLSTAGAALKIPESLSKSLHRIEECTLILGTRKIHTPDFGITFTRRLPERTGCRFHGLNEAIHIEIKQFLIEALHRFFKEQKGK